MTSLNITDNYQTPELESNLQEEATKRLQRQEPKKTSEYEDKVSTPPAESQNDTP